MSYGIRRGGAVEDFALYGDGARLCLRGRWGSIRTAKIYAEEGLRVRQLQEVASSSLAKIDYWAAEFSRRVKTI